MDRVLFICRGVIVLLDSKILTRKLLNRSYPKAMRFITLIRFLVPSNFPLEHECASEFMIELVWYLSVFKDICITLGQCF